MSQFDAHPAIVDMAKIFSSVRLLGPPLDDKLVKLVAHLFSPEEAELAIHLPFYYPRSLAAVARKARRNPEIIRPLLAAMSERRVIVGTRDGRYSLLPLIPGMFEYLLMNGVDNEWRRKYVELLMAVWRQGYVRTYNNRAIPVVRNIPVESALTNRSLVVDSDLMLEMIDRHDAMTVLNVCQCRQSVRMEGGQCKRAAPEDGCLLFGMFAQGAIDRGDGRRLSKEEMRDVVRERWEKKLVFLTGNVALDSPNAVCTCCDCCCHFLETVNEWNGNNLIAPPHFLAAVDADRCNACGKCAKVCNTRAHLVADQEHVYFQDKCIGCGGCVKSCKQEAIVMVENPEYKGPSKDFGRLSLKVLPDVAISGVRARMSR